MFLRFTERAYDFCGLQKIEKLLYYALRHAQRVCVYAPVCMLCVASLYPRNRFVAVRAARAGFSMNISDLGATNR